MIEKEVAAIPKLGRDGLGRLVLILAFNRAAVTELRRHKPLDFPAPEEFNWKGESIARFYMFSEETTIDCARRLEVIVAPPDANDNGKDPKEV
jgi:hypothetical protein